jgi:hypothetical protein
MKTQSLCNQSSTLIVCLRHDRDSRVEGLDASTCHTSMDLAVISDNIHYPSKLTVHQLQPLSQPLFLQPQPTLHSIPIYSLDSLFSDIKMAYRRKKSLLIGINYVGSGHELKGCHSDVDNMAEFLSYRGYNNSHKDRVILTDRPEVPYDSPYYPTGHNLVAAMDWLVSEPGCTLFMHYSGHGGQIADVDGNRGHTGMDSSLVPTDFESRGQISSTLLHEHLVTRMARDCTLFVIMDCCHSGSVLELPFVYRSDSDGQISLMDNLKAGMQLANEARDIISGGFSYSKVGEAQELLAGATTFFKGLRHFGQEEEEGLDEGEFAGQYGSEQKMVTMFSGCKDDQTSADARIAGEATGAMTWAFLEMMKQSQSPSYAEVSQRH